MLKGGYTFEKYSVAIPYIEVDVMLKGSSRQMKPEPAASSHNPISQTARPFTSTLVG